MFSEPMVGEKFFGREEVLELLNKRVMALKDGYRQNVALTGQSLAGKSSIILHFLHTVQEEGFIPVYIEVVKEPFRSFANKFIATILYNALRKIGESVSTDLDLLMERSQKMLPKLFLSIRQVNGSIDRGDIDEAYMNLLGLTSELKNEAGLSCVVILDEFDNLENLGVKNPFLSFGKVIMVQKDTMYIVSSSRNQAIKKIISEKLSLLFGNFEVVKVSNFEAASAGRFIDIKLGGFEIEDPLKKFLIAFTDGNPFYLEKLVAAIKSIATERMSSYVSEEIAAEAILDLVYNANGIIHQYLLNFIFNLLDNKSKESYLSMLITLAMGHNKPVEIARSRKMKQGEVTKGLIHMIELGIVSKNGAFYKIDDVMLEFWLKYVYQRRKDLLIDGTFDKIALFTSDVRSYIANFVSESSKSVGSRITELFNRFSNELVQFESRNMRLPHFTKVELKSFSDSKTYVSASFRGNYWIAQPYETNVSENDIITYVRNTKSLDCKISNKIIMPLRGIDENAKLIAKELKIAIWDINNVNSVLELYGKERIVVL